MFQRRVTTAAPASIHCATYSRMACFKEGEDNTKLRLQQEACRRLAAERGWKIYHEYVDLGGSGLTAKGRPQFSAMMQDALASAPPFTEIIVSEDSRFYRDYHESKVARARLASNGVHVNSVVQPMADDGLPTSLAITIQAVVDEQHRKMTARKIRRGIKSTFERILRLLKGRAARAVCSDATQNDKR